MYCSFTTKNGEPVVGFLIWAGIGSLCLCSCSEGKVPAGRPNVLIFIADDMSYPHAGAYGCEWVSTPGFDRVAEAGLLFTNAYTPNAKSAPSRACLLTGKYSWELEAAGNHITNWPAGKFPTFMETLAANGYHAGYTGKGWAPGNPGNINGSPRELTGEAYDTFKCTPPAKYMSNLDYAENFRSFLETRPEHTPWVFWVGTQEPHRPYEFGAGLRSGAHPGDVGDIPKYLPDNEVVRTDFTDYAFEIAYLDAHLCKIMELLEASGDLDNTIVIVTADNGMPFPRAKGNQYNSAVHLPLAIQWKNGIVRPGREEASCVSFIDIAPTLLRVCGVEDSGMAVSGREMTDLFRDDPDKDRSWIVLGQERHDYGRPRNQGYPIRSIIKDGYLYINNLKPHLWPSGNPETGYLNTDGSPTKTEILEMRRSGAERHFWTWSFGKREAEELYDLGDDPDCMNNLAGQGRYAGMMDEMKDLLYRERLRTGDPRLGPDGDVFDRYPFDHASSEDFYERYMAGEIGEYQTGWCHPSDYECPNPEAKNRR